MWWHVVWCTNGFCTLKISACSLHHLRYCVFYRDGEYVKINICECCKFSQQCEEEKLKLLNVCLAALFINTFFFHISTSLSSLRTLVLPAIYSPIFTICLRPSSTSASSSCMSPLSLLLLFSSLSIYFSFVRQSGVTTTVTTTALARSGIAMPRTVTWWVALAWAMARENSNVNPVSNIDYTFKHSCI